MQPQDVEPGFDEGFEITWQHGLAWSCPATVDLTDPLDHPVLWFADGDEHVPVCSTCGRVGPWFDRNGKPLPGPGG